MKKTAKTNKYRSLKEVWAVLRNYSPARDIAKRIGISPQGLRQKCIGPQFFTPTETVSALEVLDEVIAELQGIRDAVAGFPTRVSD